MDSPTVPILHPKLNKPSPGPRIEQLNVERIQTDPIYDIFSVGLRQTCETKQVSGPGTQLSSLQQGITFPLLSCL